MARVNWRQLNADVFEDLVACLLKTLYADADKIDGKGGDSGRDLRIMTPSGELIYQIKYLQPRLGNEQGHRRQVSQSLERAAQLNPRRWTLVVPIDLTEGEQMWLQKAAAKYSFPVDHHGANWLDTQLAKQPQIPRYFLENTAAEVVRLMTELQREQGALAGGVADAAQRISALADQIDQISPYYRVDWSVVDGQPAMAVVPRYKGAEVDSPIVVGVTTDFPNTPTGRRAAADYQQLLDYGKPTKIQRQHVKRLQFLGEPGLIPPVERATVIIGPTSEDENFRADAVFEVANPAGEIIASLPILLAGRTRGAKGTVVTGTDTRGVVAVELLMRLDGTGSINLGYQLPGIFYPAEVLPALRMLSACTLENMVTLAIAGTAPIELNLSNNRYPGAASTYRTLTSLAHIQLRSGTLFPISELTKIDQLNIQKLDSIFRRQPYEFTWKPPFLFTIEVQSATDIRRILAQLAQPGTYRLLMDYGETVAGHWINAGPCQMTITGAKLAQRQAFDPGRLRQGTTIEVRMIPVGTATARIDPVPDGGDST
jgi:hypothetical protein